MGKSKAGASGLAQHNLKMDGQCTGKSSWGAKGTKAKQMIGRRAFQAEGTASAKVLRWTVLVEEAARRPEGLMWPVREEGRKGHPTKEQLGPVGTHMETGH